MAETKFIEFTEFYKVQDAAGAEFEAGSVYEVSPESARHFLRRNVAKYVGAVLEYEAEPDEVDEFPKHVGGGWYELSDGERIRGADAAIDAQIERDQVPETLDDPPGPSKMDIRNLESPDMAGKATDREGISERIFSDE